MALTLGDNSLLCSTDGVPGPCPAPGAALVTSQRGGPSRPPAEGGVSRAPEANCHSQGGA